jgi:DNA (cytosine-5)-methyltransferase 1
MKHKRQATLIDLFAGCGGLSLGLELAGFEPIFVNELHPDAMETYLVNRPGSALRLPKNHVNDILELTQNSGELKAFAKRIRGEYGEVDIIAGGPPCQGFSGIGHRRTFTDLKKMDIPSNHLYREMAAVIEAVGPKLFLFENVRGLLNSKWSPSGSPGEIWEAVQSTFSNMEVKVGKVRHRYHLYPSLVHARDYGVPQNRPRILLVGIRDDQDFTPDPTKRASGALPEPINNAPDLADLLGDLVDPDWQPGGATPVYVQPARTRVQKMLRTGLDGKVARVGDPVTEQEYNAHSVRVIKKFTYMLEHGGKVRSQDQTKKFAQRLLPERWGPMGPTITATSLADDYVHFSQPRVLTVREWARLQTFPDWYQFHGKRTTGGRRRAGDPAAGIWLRDLPRYTQIGNAVPVLMAHAVGRHLRKLLGYSESA